jgi:hypothetical protein
MIGACVATSVPSVRTSAEIDKTSLEFRQKRL